MLVMEGCLVAGPAQKWQQTPLQGSNAICLQVREKEKPMSFRSRLRNEPLLDYSGETRKPLPNRVSVDGSGTW